MVRMSDTEALSYLGVDYGGALTRSSKFRLVSPFHPSDDQERAITELVKGIEAQRGEQVLLGVTGSGKTFTMAKVIEALNRPTLVLSHNKTLAAQLYQEFTNFFPDNAVEYFVSYYDYYQPEAYIAATDTYIEKEALINEEIDRLRHSATRSLFERHDCIIVASVSCIYGLGSPEAYYGMLLMLQEGQQIRRDEILGRLVEIQYERNDFDLMRGCFRVRGDVIEVVPSYQNYAIRIELFGDQIDSISQFGSAHRRNHQGPSSHTDLSQVSLRNPPRPLGQRRREHQAGTGSESHPAGNGKPASRGATAAPANHVRPGDDQDGRVLPRHRELPRDI